MKKTVRIRKALPGEKPGYYNKTAKFLKKASMGMSVTSELMDPQRLNKIYDYTYASLLQDTPPESLYNELTAQYALDQNTALSILQQAIGQLSEEGHFDKSKLPQNNQQQNQDTTETDTTAEDEERAASDAEQEELAMSDQGYYDEEEARMNDNTHLQTEQNQQQEGFAKYGGYFNDGGEYEEEDYAPNEEEEAVINQYSNINSEEEQPFTLEELIAMTPGTQNIEAFPDLSYYTPKYIPVSGYKNGGELQKFQPGGSAGTGLGLADDALNFFTKGPSYLRGFSPMTNLSTARKLLPLASLTGQAVSNLPLIGSKFAPKLGTTFTQNRDELWNVLHGADPKLGVFSQTGSYTGGADGSLSADRLLMYEDDIMKIVNQIEQEGQTAFKLGEINPIAQQDGLVSGVYPLDSKIIGGTDDNGFKFFELTHKFGPNQKLPFGSTSSKAKELTFKNRFYYNTDEAGQIQVFDPLGNPLSKGTQTKYAVNQPIGGKLLKKFGDFTLRDPNTPASGLYTEQGLMTGTPPSTWDRLGGFGKFGRLLETYGTTGLNKLFRAGVNDVQKIDYPVLGYRNAALGPNVIDPAQEGSYAADIANANNYKYRIGRNTIIGALGAFGLGYGTYNALNPCQCEDPLAPNYQLKDKYGICPCGTDVGERRILDPTGLQYKGTYDPKKVSMPDSMKFLRDKGKYPDREMYYRYQDSNVVNPNMDNSIPKDDFATGGVTKDKFIKRLSTMFEPGGETSTQNIGLGKGKRNDNLTGDIEGLIPMLKGKLKNNSNIALTKQIYENTQNDPEIRNLLMQNGMSENLASENNEIEEAKYGIASPRQYRRMYRQLNRMMPRGVDISRAGLAANFYDKRFTNPPYGYLSTFPNYMNMMAGYGNQMMNMYNNLSGSLPTSYSRIPAQVQAENAVNVNNLKNIEELLSRLPINSPFLGGFEQGGIVDMDAENPLTRFVYGGYDSKYYEPDVLPQASNGTPTCPPGYTYNETTQLCESSAGGVTNPAMSYEQWYDDQIDPDNWPGAIATNEPGDYTLSSDPAESTAYDTWYDNWSKEDSGAEGKRFQEYQNYLNFYNQPFTNQIIDNKPNVEVQNDPNAIMECSPGTVWDPQLQTCIPRAQVRYNQRVVDGYPFGNPFFGYAGSWTKQKSLPYELATGNAYTGQLTGSPIARYVTKRDRRGREKKYIDIYNVGDAGVSLSDLQKMMEQNKYPGDPRILERIHRRLDRANKNSDQDGQLSKRDQLDEDIKKRYGYSDEEWENTDRKGKRRERIAERYEQGRGLRHRTNEAYENLKDSALGKTAKFYGNIGKKVKNFLTKKDYGGLIKMQPGGNPFGAFNAMNQTDLFGNSTSPYAPYSQDQRFMNDLLGSKGPSSVPKAPQNPFAFMGTGTYDQTKDTGYTLGNQGQEIIPQKESEEKKSNLVGVKNKRKDMSYVDFGLGTLVANQLGHGIMNAFERKNDCPPGTIWNNEKKICEPTNSMDMVGTQNDITRGHNVDFGTGIGFKTPEQGNDRNSMSTFGNFAMPASRYGGYMADGGFYEEPYYEEDEVRYMTPDQLEQFLAAGGQVEYL
jgi:hypothetical protein